MKKLFLLLLAVSICCYAAYGQSETVRSGSVVVIDNQSYYVHTVLKGETLYGISKAYAVTIDDLYRNNLHLEGGFKEGQVLKIPAKDTREENISPRKLSRLFDRHTVNPGETLYSISRYYGIPVATIMEDNPGLDPAILSVGQEILMRKKSKGEANEKTITAELGNYTDAYNKLDENFTYHLVEPGETLFGLATQYDTSVDSILYYNNLADGLKAGSIVRFRRISVVATTEPEAPREDIFIPISTGEMPTPIYGKNVVNVSLLLPLKDSADVVQKNFIEFYKGFLLGVEDVKRSGISVNLTLFNTGRNLSTIEDIVGSYEFSRSDIIVGPVYEETVLPVVRFAETNKKMVVNPLSYFNKIYSPMLFQMAPRQGNRYDKLTEMLEGDKNVILVSSPRYRDVEFENEIRALLPQGYKQMDFAAGTSTPALERLIERNADNVIIVSCTDRNSLDIILSGISSIRTNLAARSFPVNSINVVGSPRFLRVAKDLDRDLFFKTGVAFATSYHFDRGSEIIRNFDKRFISDYGSVPTQYAYRGYDAALIFIKGAMGEGELLQNLNEAGASSLQTKYRFEKQDNGSGYINVDWPWVFYTRDYEIEIR